MVVGEEEKPHLILLHNFFVFLAPSRFRLRCGTLLLLNVRVVLPTPLMRFAL